jgi:putative ABC transport system substrate-binding protein
VPAATRVGVLVNPTNAVPTETTLRDLEPAARSLGLQIRVVRATTSREIDAAFAMLAGERADALFVGSDGFFLSRRVQIAMLAVQRSIPAAFPSRENVEVGGLMSYGTNIADAWRQAGSYAGRILKGTKPADLPVVQATKFELVINHQTARALGIEVPAMLLARADEVIE